MRTSNNPRSPASTRAMTAASVGACAAVSAICIVGGTSALLLPLSLEVLKGSREPSTGGSLHIGWRKSRYDAREIFAPPRRGAHRPPYRAWAGCLPRRTRQVRWPARRLAGVSGARRRDGASCLTRHVHAYRRGRRDSGRRRDPHSLAAGGGLGGDGLAPRDRL